MRCRRHELEELVTGDLKAFSILAKQDKDKKQQQYHEKNNLKIFKFDINPNSWLILNLMVENQLYIIIVFNILT